MKISNVGIELIKKYEGCKLKAYKCSAGVNTIGWGHTKKVKLNMKINIQKAYEFLLEDIAECEKCINEKVKVELNQNQFDALCSWVFNLGCGNLSKSTLLKLLNKGEYDKIPFEINKWCYAKSVKLAGLVTRREEEAVLFSKIDKDKIEDNNKEIKKPNLINQIRSKLPFYR